MCTLHSLGQCNTVYSRYKGTRLSVAVVNINRDKLLDAADADVPVKSPRMIFVVWNLKKINKLTLQPLLWRQHHVT